MIFETRPTAPRRVEAYQIAEDTPEHNAQSIAWISEWLQTRPDFKEFSVIPYGNGLSALLSDEYGYTIAPGSYVVWEETTETLFAMEEDAFNEKYQPAKRRRRAVRPEPAPVVKPSNIPTTMAFALAWNEVEVTAGPQDKPRRELLAEKYGVTVWAIDKWTRKARNAGLIPEHSTEKKKKKETT